MMAHSLMIVAVLVALAACVTGDLCSTYSAMQFVSNGGGQHTACKSKSGSVSVSDQQLIVNNHNRVRRDVTDAQNMMKMTWDDKAADMAQRWAEACDSKAHDDNHLRNLHGWYTLGQNAASGQSSWQEAMDDWEDEKDHWTYGSKKRSAAGVTGHYTQMIWATSDKIGCGYAVCGSKKTYVCNYGPAGNSYGEQPYIQATDANPAASECKNAKDGLCDCSGKTCRNTGKLNPKTCTCSCPATTIAAEDCKYKSCSDVSNWGVCGDSWPFTYCSTLSNAAVEYCPQYCGLCPSINEIA